MEPNTVKTRAPDISLASLAALRSKNKTPVLGNAIPILGVKPKRGCYVFWLFFKIGLCSATSLKRSRRELSIDVAEHGSMLKNYQNTHYPCFSFIPKTGMAFPNRGIFYSVSPLVS